MFWEIIGRKDAVGLRERIAWTTPKPLQLGYRTGMASKGIGGCHEFIVIFSYLDQDPSSQLSILFSEVYDRFAIIFGDVLEFGHF
jgi:hypothetical protein